MLLVIALAVCALTMRFALNASLVKPERVERALAHRAASLAELEGAYVCRREPLLFESDDAPTGDGSEARALMTQQEFVELVANFPRIQNCERAFIYARAGIVPPHCRFVVEVVERIAITPNLCAPFPVASYMLQDPNFAELIVGVADAHVSRLDDPAQVRAYLLKSIAAVRDLRRGPVLSSRAYTSLLTEERLFEALSKSLRDVPPEEAERVSLRRAGSRLTRAVEFPYLMFRHDHLGLSDIDATSVDEAKMYLVVGSEHENPCRENETAADCLARQRPLPAPPRLTRSNLPETLQRGLFLGLVLADEIWRTREEQRRAILDTWAERDRALSALVGAL